MGDTPFALGCGRLSEGTDEQMWESRRKLADLPPETVMDCAHEYAQATTKVAFRVERVMALGLLPALKVF